MKLSELKPCAMCNGSLLKPPAGSWYVIRLTQALIDPKAARETGGLAMMFGGFNAPGALAVAEALSPNADAVMIMGDKDASLTTELHVCFDCMVQKLSPLLHAAEVANREPDEPGHDMGRDEMDEQRAWEARRR